MLDFYCALAVCVIVSAALAAGCIILLRTWRPEREMQEPGIVGTWPVRLAVWVKETFSAGVFLRPIGNCGTLPKNKADAPADTLRESPAVAKREPGTEHGRYDKPASPEKAGSRATPANHPREGSGAAGAQLQGRVRDAASQPLLSPDLGSELLAWLDQQEINSENIGSIRRRCFMPWNSQWNALVRDETAAREISSITSTETNRPATLPPEGKADESPEGPGRGGNKPLMRNRTANEVPPPIGKSGGNNFASDGSAPPRESSRAEEQLVPWCCPVCLGRGWHKAGFYTSPVCSAPELCRTCNGTTLVWGRATGAGEKEASV